jgi:hypothetical protein
MRDWKAVPFARGRRQSGNRPNLLLKPTFLALKLMSALISARATRYAEYLKAWWRTAPLIVVRFNATTLWHIDAAEWAPSTASFTTFSRFWHVRSYSNSNQGPDVQKSTLCARTRTSATGHTGLTLMPAHHRFRGVAHPTSRISHGIRAVHAREGNRIHVISKPGG